MHNASTHTNGKLAMAAAIQATDPNHTVCVRGLLDKPSAVLSQLMRLLRLQISLHNGTFTVNGL